MNSSRGRLRNQVVSSFGLIVMIHWLGEVWIRIRDISVILPLFFVSFGESHLLVSWCAGGRCGMACSDEDHGRSRRPGLENRGWSHRSGTQWPDDREVRWRCMWSAPCTWRREARVSWLSLKTKVDGLWVVWPQNHSYGFLRFGLKTGGDSSLQFGLKTSGSGFSVWVSKPTFLIWWFGPQNHHNGFLVCAWKSSRLRFIGCVTKPTEGGWWGTHVEI
jgi:hypothetical protein